MKLLIAEKPSVAQELARAVGAYQRNEGYIAGGSLHGEPCRVTWAVGHMVEMTCADTPARWSREALPLIPETFVLNPVKGREKQLGVIRTLLRDTDTVVNCGDAGREGELIQRQILSWCGWRGPVQRLWISSLTDEAVRQGLRNLHRGKDYDPLYHAGKARSEADWLVGINATMALTVAAREKNPSARGVLSLGRVQTPTLAMVCRRYIENRDFVPQDYWTVTLDTASRGTAFTVTSRRKFDSERQAKEVRDAAAASDITVIESVTRRRELNPPLPHDLTSLQKAANSRYGLTAQQTLTIAQHLYEKKLLTYPRTGSRYITEDVLATVHERMRALQDHPELGQYARSMQAKGLNMHCVDASKVTDHHALLIEKTPAEGLTEDERRIYDLVAARMLEAFSARCVQDVTTALFRCAGETFKATGTLTLSAGWKAVLKEPEKETGENDDEEPDQTLPQLSEGDILPVVKAQTKAGRTRPKPLHTEATLLSAMETAGREVEDDALREAMKDCGLGTPATRAAIIETIKSRGYVRMQGKKITPTEEGMAVWGLVKDMEIANPEMTGQWEKALGEIAAGRLRTDRFDARIREYTAQVTAQMLGSDAAGIGGEGRTVVKCPECGAEIRIWKTNAKCTNPDCGLWMSREAFGRNLSESAMADILTKGRSGVIRGLKSREGRTFDARLTLSVTVKDGRRYGNLRPEFVNKTENRIQQGHGKGRK